ncbi:hypothetical protein M8818_007616 [Zalaria obscura]|uniref:Uncharacterized protein n=1 Tax=Zalaria obscura TaxID=2024903 RepID=A0ACC3S5I5_9PEZI
MSVNADAASNQPTQQTGQFGSHIKPSEPMEKGGHKPGVLASENDRAPEFSAQTLPAGSAPADRTFKPNNISEVPPVTDVRDDNDPEAERTTAADTIGGATSADVHTGLGHPGQGQTSNELRHDGSKGRAKQTHGLEGVGASGVPAANLVDAHDPQFANQRGIDEEEAKPRGNLGGPPAEDRLNETSETVAAEAPSGR